jgi:hypothetical protein
MTSKQLEAQGHEQVFVVQSGQEQLPCLARQSSVKGKSRAYLMEIAVAWAARGVCFRMKQLWESMIHDVTLRAAFVQETVKAGGNAATGLEGKSDATQWSLVTGRGRCPTGRR